MNTKQPPVVAVLMVAVTLAGCASETPNVYDSDEYKIMFPIPTGFDLYTPGKPGPLSSHFTPGNILFVVNPEFPDEAVGANYVTNISKSTLRGLKELLETNPPHEESFSGYKRTSVRFIKIGSKSEKEAVEHVFNVKGNVADTFRQVAFIHSGKLFTFSCKASEERYDEANEELFDAIFNKMEFR